MWLSRILVMLPSNYVVLGLGSNKSFGGDSCVELLRKACRQLSPLFSNFDLSSVYRTKPMYFDEQEMFYNMVFCGFLDSSLDSYELLSKIHEIEASLGRDRSREIRNGPRSVDVDIEIFGNVVMSEPDLMIPHPRIRERAFVLVPLKEVLDRSGKNMKDDVSDFLNVGFDALDLKDGDVELFMDSKIFRSRL